MMQTLLSITVAILAAFVGFVLISAFTDSAPWAIAGAIVAAPLGFWLGGFAIGDAGGHHGRHTRT